MRWQRVLIALAAVVGAVAGVVALSAAALGADRTTAAASCSSFHDALEPGVTRQVCGPFLACYQATGGPSGHFGLPVGDERPNTLRPEQTGDRTQAFDHAQMFLTTATGHIVTGGWFAYTPLRDAQPELPSCPDP